MAAHNDAIDIPAVKAYLKKLQRDICQQIEASDGRATFASDCWSRKEGGGGDSRILTNGHIFEKGGVNFSHIHGQQMPASATARRPELTGRKYQAMGVSIVLHPNNPHVPTSHANVRFFVAEKTGCSPVWWFGGGYDLTPCYGYQEDCQHWHHEARKACQPFGEQFYPKFKTWCDEYFYLAHRQETRGVGGLFFDDFNSLGFHQSFALTQAIGNSYCRAYLPIVTRRKDQAYSEQQKQFQLYRRGRYVEFNLVYDRGTLFGLQSGGRTESILMSMPPLARWEYNFQAQPNSPEAALAREYLTPRDWLFLG